ncbi:hypothetical protein O6H91_Y435900 [Diphasiastrum complanatum]|nr:hypothetical protein O6H91_Y435900 [Diphasiastrum complanatum]
MGARSQTKQLKDALEEALRELKQAMPHLFLGAKAKKMQQCVPDLSKCLAGLITTSMDSSFKIECSKILDLPPDETNAFEVCIRKKMMSIIQVKDASQPKMLTYNDERNGSKYKEAEVKCYSESECEEWALDD